MATRPTTRLDEAREELRKSAETLAEWDTKIQALPDDAEEREIEFHAEAFSAEQRRNKRWQETVDRLQAIEVAKSEAALRSGDADEQEAAAEKRSKANDNRVLREPRTYTEQTSYQGVSFFKDVRDANLGDPAAQQRLQRHGQEEAVERRDITTTATQGGNFVPPNYLGERYAEYARESRPFADVVPTMPLMATGNTVTIPRITTGPAVASQATENTAVQETDLVEALLTVYVRTIAGQQDLSQQLFDRTDPGMDQIIFNELRADYDRELDSQMLNGAGTLGTHLGIRAVSSPNAITFTSASPTAALTVPPVYNGIQSIWTNRKAPATHVIMHPRRAAFLASNLSSTFPLFQQGQLTQAAGQQNGGMLLNFAGLPVVIDSNVRTTDGSSTNQDEMYVVRASDFILMEGPIQTRVDVSSGSANLTVRLQLWAYSAWASGRFPKSISIVSGTGLTSPSF